MDAYRNQTLIPGACTACAVGNIIAANMELEVDAKLTPHGIVNGLSWLKRDKSEVHPNVRRIFAKWSSVFGTTTCHGQEIYPDEYRGVAKAQIDSTGYSFWHLALIESAFEDAAINCGYVCRDGLINPEHVDQAILKGLFAVYDVLCEIHEVDISTVPTGKEVFASC